AAGGLLAGGPGDRRRRDPAGAAAGPQRRRVAAGQPAPARGDQLSPSDAHSVIHSPESLFAATLSGNSAAAPPIITIPTSTRTMSRRRPPLPLPSSSLPTAMPGPSCPAARGMQ